MTAVNRRIVGYIILLVFLSAALPDQALVQEMPSKAMIYDPGQLKPGTVF